MIYTCKTILRTKLILQRGSSGSNFYLLEQVYRNNLVRVAFLKVYSMIWFTELCTRLVDLTSSVCEQI